MGKVVFNLSDDCLNGDQKKAITDWYDKDKASPPVMPVVPKREVTGYAAKKEEEARRTALAGNDLVRQVMRVFLYSEYDRVLKLRDTCSFRIFNRVNFHWRQAMSAWLTYGLKQWKAQEGIYTKKRK
jgi:hypothetical protein